MSNKDIALQYLGKGLSIIPLKSPSMVSQKLPTKEFIRQCKMPLVGWKGFQTRHPTEQEVSDWFDRWPDANIGIITGKISGLVVFDLDSDHAVQYAEDEGGFPDTPKVKTGKGYHHYLRYPGFEVRNDVKKELDIDVVQFPDTETRVTAEYDEQYFRVSFAGSLLSIMESKMNGGLIGGRTYVLGGIPSSGKTVLTNNIADNICLNGQPVLFFSYDDGRTELRYRTYCRFSRNGSVSTIKKIKYVVQQIIKVDDWPQLIDKIYARHQKAPVIMIDYLRKVKTGSNRMDERLSMASFKESGSIEYEASWLGILAAVEENGLGYSLKNDWEHIVNHDGNIDLIVFKAKRGTGTTGRISLKLDKSNMTVRDRIESTKTDSVTLLKKKSKFA